jgi:hypothetical protein
MYFTSCLQPLELNDRHIFNLVKLSFPDFLTGKIRGRLMFGLIGYSAFIVHSTGRDLFLLQSFQSIFPYYATIMFYTYAVQKVAK